MGRRGKVLVATTIVVVLGWMAPAVQAQTAPTTTTTPSTTTTIGPWATTTTTAKARPTTTVAQATTTATTPAPTSTSSAVPFPSGLLAIANSVKRSPPSNDALLLAALAPLQKLGYTAQQAMIMGMGQFPVAGPAFWADDWLEPRPGPVPRLHHGDDIVAAMGTPIRSPSDGVLLYDTSDPAGYGLAAMVTGPDKTVYVMAHMSATVAGLSTGSAVKLGQVVGFVGATGDATGPHVHFEVRPNGAVFGIDPKPILDAWQKAAIAGIPVLMQLIQGTVGTAPAVAAPVPVVLPLPGPLYSPSLPGALPIRKVPPSSPAGLALIALLALLATSGWAAIRYGTKAQT